MYVYLLLVLAFVLPASGFAQTNNPTNNILTTKVYRKGLYKTLDEFKTNSPSDTTTQVSLKERTGTDIYLNGGTRYRLMAVKPESGKQTPLRAGYFGYSDGKNLYVALLGLSKSVDVEQIETLGLYCYFTTSQAFTPREQVLGSAPAKEGTFNQPHLLNINNGLQSALTLSFAQKLQADDEELKTRFGNLKQYTGDPKDFIVAYNQRHQALVQPIALKKSMWDSSDSLTYNILTTKIYRPGIYRNFQEFKTNSPSYNDTAFVLYTRTDKEIYWQGDNRYKIYIRDKKGDLSGTYDKPYWGYCDGTHIYIKAYGTPNKTELEKVEVQGLYSLYNSHKPKSHDGVVIGAGAAFGVAGALAASLVTTIAEKEAVEAQPYVFDFNTGTVYKLTPRRERKILAQDKALEDSIYSGGKDYSSIAEFLHDFNRRNRQLITPF